jgi:chromosomal replication initiation ATPase DnaA
MTTELQEAEEALEQIVLVTNTMAVERIDKALVEVSGRDLVSSAEMTDLLLDVRQILVIDLEEMVSGSD